MFERLRMWARSDAAPALALARTAARVARRRLPDARRRRPPGPGAAPHGAAARRRDPGDGLGGGARPHPPVQGVGRGEVGVRINHLTGAVSEWRDGSVLVVPGLQRMRVFSLRDQSWRAAQMSRADGPAPLQSVEGLSLGVDLTVRYALDPLKVAAHRAKSLPDDIGARDRRAGGAGRDLQGVRALHGARDLLDQARRDPAGDRDRAEAASSPPTASCCARVQIGKVDLPADYRRGMESLLAEELAGEKMRYTLELKDKRVRETELDARGREGAPRDRRRGRRRASR